MFRLEDIGFYTLENARAQHASATSPLWRCELLLTDHCNFHCPYCRGMKNEYRGSLTFDQAVSIVDKWIEGGLRNVRFSGGEPTIWPRLAELVEHTRRHGVKRIALSTNGSASMKTYYELIEAGVNDFSVSLDACCASIGDMMAGNIEGIWGRVVENIKQLSMHRYTTVGVVLTPDNATDVAKIIEFSSRLGVSDIRIIPSAQWNQQLTVDIADHFLNRHQILNYRITNVRKGRHVRGLTEKDYNRCPLALDDMVSVAGYHFPCIIHFREGGKPIGRLEGTIQEIREQRREWARTHDTFQDPICKENCLDVCIDYNNTFKALNKGL